MRLSGWQFLSLGEIIWEAILGGDVTIWEDVLRLG